MEDLRNVRNNDTEKRTSEKSGYVPPDDDTLREDLYKAEHSYQPYPDRPVGQEYSDEDSMLPKNQINDSMNQDSFHTYHSVLAESLRLHQLPDLKILSELPLPSPNFCWSKRLYYSQWLLLYYKKQYSGIQIRPTHTGTYSIILGNRDLLEVTTLRQAIAICHTIAWIFKDSLPVPRRLVNTNATEAVK